MIRYEGDFFTLGWGTVSLKFRQFCDAFGEMTVRLLHFCVPVRLRRLVYHVGVGACSF